MHRFSASSGVSGKPGGRLGCCRSNRAHRARPWQKGWVGGESSGSGQSSSERAATVASTWAPAEPQGEKLPQSSALRRAPALSAKLSWLTRCDVSREGDERWKADLRMGAEPARRSGSSVGTRPPEVRTHSRPSNGRRRAGSRAPLAPAPERGASSRARNKACVVWALAALACRLPDLPGMASRP
jgi:hypothetical protein